MNIAVLLAYILAVVVLIGTPGPIVALVMNAASRHGFKYALITVLGSNLASLVLLACAALVIAHYDSWRGVHSDWQVDCSGIQA